MAVTGFAAQSRRAHAAVGEFQRCGDAEAQQRVVGDAAWIGQCKFPTHVAFIASLRAAP
jgi:hypothetical protein